MITLRFWSHSLFNRYTPTKTKKTLWDGWEGAAPYVGGVRTKNAADFDVELIRREHIGRPRRREAVSLFQAMFFFGGGGVPLFVKRSLFCIYCDSST